LRIRRRFVSWRWKPQAPPGRQPHVGQMGAIVDASQTGEPPTTKMTRRRARRCCSPILAIALGVSADELLDLKPSNQKSRPKRRVSSNVSTGSTRYPRPISAPCSDSSMLWCYPDDGPASDAGSQLTRHLVRIAFSHQTQDRATHLKQRIVESPRRLSELRRDRAISIPEPELSPAPLVPRSLCQI
jgi:hypothetical protein